MARQSLKRAMTKAACRVVIYRAVNDLLDAVMNAISSRVSSEKDDAPVVASKKTSRKKKVSTKRA